MQKEHSLPPDTHTQEMFTLRKVLAAVLRFAFCLIADEIYDIHLGFTSF